MSHEYISLRAFAFGIANAICKGILALMHQTSPTSNLQTPIIAKKFAIVLQCNSTFKIVL